MTKEPFQMQRLRFSVRLMVLAIVFLAVCFAWVGNNVRRTRRGQIAVRELEAVGATLLDFDWAVDARGRLVPERPPKGWTLSLVDYAVAGGPWVRVVEVDLRHCEIDGDHMRHVAALPNVQRLRLDNTSIDDADLARVVGMSRLEVLTLNGTSISDRGLVSIASFRKLRILELGGTNVSDGGLRALCHLEELKSLSLGDTDVRGAGLVHLTHLRNLQCLDLAYTSVGDDDFPILARFDQLQSLDVQGTAISASTLARLREVLPHTYIYSGNTQ